MSNYIQEMLEKKNWAIYGITTNEFKFGYKIPLRMQEHNYNVIGINKKYEGTTIEGIPVYGSVLEYDGTIDVVDMIINPSLALEALDEIKQMGIEFVWFQPGTWNQEVIQQAQSLGLKIVYDDCVYAILGRK